MVRKSRPELIDAKQTFETIMARLKTALGLKRDSELARELGMSTSDFAQRKRRGRVPWDRVLMLANLRKISTDWLLTGTGPMYRREPDELSEQERKLLELFEALPEEQRREILATAEEKKRLLELERRLQELERRVKRAG